jgi:hypothetical protein
MSVPTVEGLRHREQVLCQESYAARAAVALKGQNTILSPRTARQASGGHGGRRCAEGRTDLGGIDALGPVGRLPLA